jgi:hypothetical protein
VDDPSLVVTLAGLVAGLAIGGLANWQLRRPFDLRWPVVPWLGLQFLAVAAVLVFGGHLLSLLTGHPFAGRTGY